MGYGKKSSNTKNKKTSSTARKNPGITTIPKPTKNKRNRKS